MLFESCCSARQFFSRCSTSMQTVSSRLRVFRSWWYNYGDTHTHLRDQYNQGSRTTPRACAADRA